MRIRSFSFGLYIVLALAAIFWLPLHVPMQPSQSGSYAVGFNNRASLYAIILALAVGCFTVRGFRFSVPEEDRAIPIGPDRKTIVRGLLVCLALCGFTTLIASQTWGIDEAPYLIGRASQLFHGHRLYSDFEFIYGPALLYLPVWAAKLFHIEVGPAYFIVWNLEWLIGVYMLALVVRGLGFHRPRANAAFWVLFSLFFSSIFNTGETYTPFREVAALLGLLAVHHLLGCTRQWLAFAAAVGVAAVLFLISPEMSIAFMAACSLYLLLAAISRGWWKYPRFLACFAGMLVLFAVEVRLAFIAHEFDSARQFGRGGADTAYLLTPTTLYVLALLFLAGCFAAHRLIKRDMFDSRIAAVVMAFALLPGAVGRADPSHVVLYGTGSIMVALAIASAGSLRTWRAAVILTVLFCSVPLVLLKWKINRLMFMEAGIRMFFPDAVVPPSGIGHWIDQQVYKRGGEKARLQLHRRLWRSPRDPHDVFPQASRVVAAPFGYSVRGYASTVREDVYLGYLDGTNDLMSPMQVQRKINELVSHPDYDLLLPVRLQDASFCVPDGHAAITQLKEQYGYSYLRKQPNRQEVLLPLCTFILEHYTKIAEPRDEKSIYNLWRNNELVKH